MKNKDKKAIRKLAKFLSENYRMCAPQNENKQCIGEEEECKQCWIDWAYKDD